MWFTKGNIFTKLLISYFIKGDALQTPQTSTSAIKDRTGLIPELTVSVFRYILTSPGLLQVRIASTVNLRLMSRATNIFRFQPKQFPVFASEPF